MLYAKMLKHLAIKLWIWRTENSLFSANAL